MGNSAFRGNAYKEGTVPPPLTPEEQAQLDKDIETLRVIPEPEAPGNEWEDICDQIELLDLSDNGEEEELDTLYGE
jgi:hypothetical protein